jgi:hypothetical protein
MDLEAQELPEAKQRQQKEDADNSYGQPESRPQPLKQKNDLRAPNFAV